MSDSIFGMPFAVDTSLPPGTARIGGRLHRLEGRNAAAWTAGAVAYGARKDAERGMRRERDRDHVWLVRPPWRGAGLVRASARATALSWQVGVDPAAPDVMEAAAPGWRDAQALMALELVESARRGIAHDRLPPIMITGI